MPSAPKTPPPKRKRKAKARREGNVSNREVDEYDPYDEDTDIDEIDEEVNFINADFKANLAFVAAAIVGVAVISVIAISYFRGQRKQQEEMDAYLNALFRAKQTAAAYPGLEPAKVIAVVAAILTVIAIISYQKRYYDRIEQTEYNKRIQIRWLSATAAVFILIVAYFAKANYAPTVEDTSSKHHNKMDLNRYLPFLIGLALAYNTRNVARYICPTQQQPVLQQQQLAMPQPHRLEQFRDLPERPLDYFGADAPRRPFRHDSRYSAPELLPPLEQAPQPQHFLVPKRERWHDDTWSEDMLYCDRYRRNPDNRRRKKRKHKKKWRYGDRGDSRGCALRHQHCQPIIKKRKSQVYQCDISGGQYYDSG